jgi:RND family efflux transporter, MFP subunit
MTFNMSEQDVLRIRANMAKRNLTLKDIDKVPCEVGLMIEEGFPHEGRLDYAAPEVDPSTGTLLVRCIFENKNRALIPGLFARVRVPLLGQTGKALLVPDVAIGTSQLGRYLLLVDKDNSVEQRVVEVGQLFGNLREITKGLAADDRVVISDTQRAIPGRKVAPRKPRSPRRRRPALSRDRGRAQGMISKFFIERPVLANVLAIVFVSSAAWRSTSCPSPNIPMSSRPPSR